ncbi:hypothetical protein J1G44_06020 [Cellulomonas sp. zg-ZUI199]|uniref:Uncharacterized protein n=1 Tax=Cellulomonas wangleii TaxID=2816956 RepID=A0ABX8D3L9_9CELL|nr:hypothetical protein [Cellulomonas wangleii]MBO0923753.1 hypothetical protein [Cellulomonas wangleii]MBO0924035.1 hypothetical protein [Cellulomonas wangleii]QVI62062.1 hypothetical protein KG103_16870 [Cellulomonas wangleii]
MSDLALDPPTHVVCVSISPGHVVQPELVARAVAASGTPWRLAVVGPHRIGLEHASGATATWWLHDHAPFVAHLRTDDPTVWVHDDLGVVRVGDRYVAVASREKRTPCLRTLQRRPGRTVAWRVASLQPEEGAGDGRPIPPHTATLYHLDPPLRHGRRPDAAPVDWVLVLAYQYRGGGSRRSTTQTRPGGSCPTCCCPAAPSTPRTTPRR